MRVLIFVSLFFGFVCGDMDPDFRNKEYIPVMPRFPRAKNSSNQFHKSEINPFIVGGQEVKPNSIPYQAVLFIDDQYLCGGSLIHSNWVLTAAHCLVIVSSFIIIVLGAHNIREEETTQIVRFVDKVEHIIPHYLFSYDTFDNDIGLIYLEEPVKSTEKIHAIPLPTSDLRANVEVTVSGWGLTSDDEDATISNVLKKAKVKTISNEKCDCYYNGLIIPNILCTVGGRDGTCNGDSGGPLTHPENGYAVLYGLTSFASLEGCTSRFPHGFQRIFPHLEWINTKIEYCSAY